MLFISVELGQWFIALLEFTNLYGFTRVWLRFLFLDYKTNVTSDHFMKRFRVYQFPGGKMLTIAPFLLPWKMHHNRPNTHCYKISAAVESGDLPFLLAFVFWAPPSHSDALLGRLRWTLSWIYFTSWQHKTWSNFQPSLLTLWDFRKSRTKPHFFQMALFAEYDETKRMTVFSIFSFFGHCLRSVTRICKAITPQQVSVQLFYSKK